MNLNSTNGIPWRLDDLKKRECLRDWTKTTCPVEGTIRWVIVTNWDETLHMKTNEVEALLRGAMMTPPT